MFVGALFWWHGSYCIKERTRLEGGEINGPTGAAGTERREHGVPNLYFQIEGVAWRKGAYPAVAGMRSRHCPGIFQCDTLGYEAQQVSIFGLYF